MLLRIEGKELAQPYTHCVPCNARVHGAVHHNMQDMYTLHGSFVMQYILFIVVHVNIAGNPLNCVSCEYTTRQRLVVIYTFFSHNYNIRSCE